MKLKNEFRITCHAIGQIMSNPRDKNAEFSATCLKHVYGWLRRQPEFYGRRSKSLSNKYCDKGLAKEDDSIEFASRFFGWGLVEKNTVRKFEDWIEGEADVVLANSVEDIKNSWDEETFPLFHNQIETTAYIDQLQGYSFLYDKPNAGLIYTLMDAPDFIIEREAWKIAREAGLDELPEDLFQDVKKNMSFEHYPDELRIKRFSIERDDIRIGKIYSKVQDIRRFIHELPDIETLITLHEDELIL